MKKETFYKKSDRVYKELTDIMKKDGKITSLTDDQRHMLTIGFGDESAVYKSFKIDMPIWMDDIINDSIQNDKNKMIEALSNAFDQCERFVTKENLVYVSYGFDDYTGKDVAVNGYHKKSDRELIDGFVREYEEEKREQERIKKQQELAKKASKKTITIDGKKYQLVE